MLLMLATPPPAVAADDTLVGHWAGVMTHAGATVGVAFDFTPAQGGLAGSFSSAQQRVLEYPFDSVAYSAPRIGIKLGDGDVVFNGTVSHGEMRGTFRDREVGAGTFTLHQTVPQTSPYASEDVTFRNGNVVLAGSLYVPSTPGRHPAIVFLQGSGPEIRWGANRFWADYFARRGVAALIYDKRGSGKSSGNWRTSNFNDLAGDALAGIALLRSRPDIDSAQIGIHGHSQGATIAPLIAARSGSVAFVVAVSGSGVPMWKSEIYSLHHAMTAARIHGAALRHADAAITRVIDYARTGTRWEKVAAAQASWPKESWHDALSVPKNSYFWPFFKKIANFDSAVSWRRVRVPVLIVQAGDDEHIPVEASTRAMRGALTAANNPDYTIVVMPGAPHTFVVHPQAVPRFRWPFIYPGFADLLGAWVRYRTVDRTAPSAL
jgi:dienelactone hydrolase